MNSPSDTTPPAREVVITGLGVVSPIGIGREPFWQSLCAGASGVRKVSAFDTSGTPFHFGGEVGDFDPKQYVRPRKSLKVMSREIQFAVTAADLAARDAGLETGHVDPDRFGVIFGCDMILCQPAELSPAFHRCLVDHKFDFRLWGPSAMAEMYPLWMLKYLPNMPACHIAIAHDARGPTNSHVLEEVSSLLALSEAMRVIERGQADVILAGGTGSRIHPTIWVRSSLLPVSRRGDPAKMSRPFDALRDGFVNGEGAAAFVLESREHARRRQARVLARLAGYASAFEPRPAGRPAKGTAVRATMARALRMARLSPEQLGHVNANGLGTVDDDRLEAQAIRAELGQVPVTAPKSFFGNLGSGTGAVEMAASLLGLEMGLVPFTLNYENPDPECPVHVVHGSPLEMEKRTALILNQSLTGQAAAVVLRKEEV